MSQQVGEWYLPYIYIDSHWSKLLSQEVVKVIAPGGCARNVDSLKCVCDAEILLDTLKSCCI